MQTIETTATVTPEGMLTQNVQDFGAYAHLITIVPLIPPASP